MILLLSLWAIVLASASSSSQHHTRRPELPSGGDPITSFQVIESEKIEETPVGINQEDVAPIMNASDVFLVIGVKTAVVKNFDLRQAIRETWASANTLPVDVKVFFIGCAPDLTEVHDDDERQQTRYAINLEKQTYGDLLTDELRCEDTYAVLPNKVKEFLRFATPQFARTPFFMIADDDIYLRAGELVDELRDVDRSQRLYIGQVWDKLLGRSQTPVRDTTARYYISKDFYPLHTYPTFAFGPHYLLSMDCARFIGKNSGRLRGLGAIDDVSIALWLMTMQVYVKHTAAFSNLRLGACKNDLISLADLSPYGIRSIHSNLFQKRNMCFGFDRALWQMDTIINPSLCRAERNVAKCGSIAKSSIGFDGLPAGRYSARAFITDERGIIRYRETPPVSITIVTKEEFAVYSAAMMELSGDSSRNGSSLLKWATHQQVLESLSIPTIGGTKTDATSNGTLLVIGVKTAVVKNFEFRQTIRETWASPDALPHNVKVFFGLWTKLSAIKSIAERERTRVALPGEAKYGDLLTDELGCEESYETYRAR
ncbi:Glycosyl transferase, family 31 [Phytophthora cactorum]|nr:Glycosyl transferase, family 31 [Phytophthora cactorum]